MIPNYPQVETTASVNSLLGLLLVVMVLTPPPNLLVAQLMLACELVTIRGGLGIQKPYASKSSITLK